jgi:3D (Asp-Asp-Asp) domain-containing protein
LETLDGGAGVQREATTINPTPRPTQRLLKKKFTITAYCPCRKCCGQWADGITATGTKATQGRTIAVDPNIIPYGKKVVIDGKTYIAEDCGSGINGNKIDMFFSSHKEALEWGVKVKEVIILK